jgi:hypothetical protein
MDILPEPLIFDPQVVDAAISESIFNMLEGCVPEFTESGVDRQPSGSTISGKETSESGPRAEVVCLCSDPYLAAAHTADVQLLIEKPLTIERAASRSCSGETSVRIAAVFSVRRCSRCC